MKRIRHWLFNLTAGASLVLCVATVIFCVRSYSAVRWERASRVSLHRGPINGGIYLEVASWQGSVQVHYSTGARFPMYSNLGGTPDRWSLRLTARGYAGFAWSPDITGPGFVIRLPYWSLLIGAFLTAVSIAALRRKYLPHSRHLSNLCVQCGYDLRATPNRCPECGTVPK